MALLFEDAGTGNTRQWQCFVCGRNYETYEEFKSHIEESHDEGREYIKCPSCDAPVRCLKTHYKCKHPNRILPKGVQTRVAVWHDFKTGKDGKQKKTTKKMNFRQGTFYSKKCNADFIYRSGMEEEFFNLLEEDVDVESWAAEPFKVPYFWQGEWHNYIPDIRINFIDGTTEVWEIKPANQTQYEQNKAKWSAMNDHALNVGWQFVVQTEVGLGKLKAKINRQRNLNG